jgi:hypothetical protein
MLNVIDPVFLFQFFKLPTEAANILESIPLVGSSLSRLALPPIPLYLSEKLTGIYIDDEEKSIQIATELQTVSDGSGGTKTQRGIGSTTTIIMKSKKDSIGLTLLLAFFEQILPKVTSREYSITYLHGATTVFNGLLHDVTVKPEPGSDLLFVTVVLVAGDLQETTPATQVNKVSGTQNLNGTANIPTPGGGGSGPVPPATPPVSIGGPT